TCHLWSVFGTSLVDLRERWHSGKLRGKRSKKTRFPRNQFGPQPRTFIAQFTCTVEESRIKLKKTAGGRKRRYGEAFARPRGKLKTITHGLPAKLSRRKLDDAIEGGAIIQYLHPHWIPTTGPYDVAVTREYIELNFCVRRKDNQKQR